MPDTDAWPIIQTIAQKNNISYEHCVSTSVSVKISLLLYFVELYEFLSTHIITILCDVLPSFAKLSQFFFIISFLLQVLKHNFQIYFQINFFSVQAKLTAEFFDFPHLF